MPRNVIQNFWIGNIQIEANSTFLDLVYDWSMDLHIKETLARKGDMGIVACAIRLTAARMTTGLAQKDLASEAEVGKTALNNAERALTYPSREVMVYLFRAHRIDFNFILHGDFAQLPGDVQAKLFPALEAATNEWDRKAGSDRTPEKPKASPSAAQKSP